jgi:dihydroorotate dehydrogenase (NAD+) catalytic subunit
MTSTPTLFKYDRHRSYDWNFEHVPEPADLDVPVVPGDWTFCGLPVDSPLGVPAGPLLNGKWCLYYASLGFDVVTYKTVRSRAHDCYPLPNLQPVECEQITDSMTELPTATDMQGSWAVSYGMPSKEPSNWRADIEATRNALPSGKLLSVSVVATVQEHWSLDDLGADYAQCAKLAVESGADIIETNFSCPNVTTCDGQLYQQPADAGKVTAMVRDAIGTVPLVVKVGHVPTKDEARSLLDAVGNNVAAIAMTNSVATRVRNADGLLFDGQKRGICGAAIYDASLAQLRMFAEAIRARELDVELVGVGGINKAEHVEQYLAAGAQACHIATAAMVDPGIAIKIRRSISS